MGREGLFTDLLALLVASHTVFPVNARDIRGQMLKRGAARWRKSPPFDALKPLLCKAILTLTVPLGASGHSAHLAA